MIELGSLKANNTYLFIMTFELMVNQFLAFNVVDQVWEYLDELPFVLETALLVPCDNGPNKYLYAIQKDNFGCKPSTTIARIELGSFIYNQWEEIPLQVPTWVSHTGRIDFCMSDFPGETLHIFMFAKCHLTVDLTLDQEMEFWQTKEKDDEFVMESKSQLYKGC